MNDELWVYYKSYPMSSEDGTRRLNECIDDLEKHGCKYWMDLEKKSYRNPGTGEKVTDQYCTLGVRLSDIFEWVDIRKTAARNKKREFLGKKNSAVLTELHYTGGVRAVVNFQDVRLEIQGLEVKKSKNIDVTGHLEKLGFDPKQLKIRYVVS